MLERRTETDETATEDGKTRGRRVRRIEIGVVEFPMDDVGKDADSGEIIDLPGAVTMRDRLHVSVTTEDGSAGEYIGGTGAMLAQARVAAHFMIGRDAFAREELYGHVKRKLRKSDRMGPGLVDIALWDLAGKRLGVSVSALLGGFRTRVPAYASTLFGGQRGGLATPDDFAAFAETCRSLGYRAFKVHGWTDGNVEREVANVLGLGERFRGRMALMIDPACQLRTFMDAVRLGRACDEAGFLWLEDPYADGGLSVTAHQRLKALVRTPILLGEHVRGLEAMTALAVAGATDMLRADPDFDLGITGTMKLAHAAEGLGLDVEIHAPGPAQRHTMAAIRNTNWYELSMVGPNGRGFTGPELYACGYSDRLEDVGPDGAFPVPAGPGLGVTYDAARVAECTKNRVVVE